MWLTLNDKFLTEMIFLSCISPFKNNELLCSRRTVFDRERD